MAVKYSATLKHIKVYWKDGKLKKNGRTIKVESVKKLLRKINPDFTDRELWDIIFNDISVYSELKPSLRQEARYRNAEKTNARIATERKKRKQEKQFKEILANSKPSDYSLDDYMRLPTGHCIAAIMAAHPFFTEVQAKQILGQWLLKRL